MRSVNKRFGSRDLGAVILMHYVLIGLLFMVVPDVRAWEFSKIEV